MKLDFVLARFSRDQIKAEVKEVSPGISVRASEGHAARNSKFRSAIDRVRFASSPAWQQSKMTKRSPSVRFKSVSASSHTTEFLAVVFCLRLRFLGKNQSLAKFKDKDFAILEVVTYPDKYRPLLSAP